MRTGTAARHEPRPGYRVPDTPDLVAGALRGEQAAWDGLVDRYLPLVIAVTRAYRLGRADVEDVSQMVWMRLVEHLPGIREPLAVPRWIAVTTRNECRRVARARLRLVLVDPCLDDRLDVPFEPDDVEARLVQAEAQQAIRDGLAQLRPLHRDLLTVLAADPPPSYREVSDRLGIPVGSIGPTRARALGRLRETPAMRRFLGTGAAGDPVSGPAR
jgi:RNA polymerase sigma factor (sigma-70 family)